MIRYCPNCQTERALQEIFCEGEIDGHPCGWDLTGEPIRAEGWRPQSVITQDDAAQVGASEVESALPVCENGHPMEADALMCFECGAGIAPAPAKGQDKSETSAETLIDGWRLLHRISNTDGIRERYIAIHATSTRQAVLTLYHAGAEPDPAIYDVLRRLPLEYVPEIIATGRWNERAYEVAEEMTGGTLADQGIVFGQGDSDIVRHVVRELGEALYAFNEAGLRHRDLRPGTLLVRSRDPLDLVISGFGSARLSEFDLDRVSPLETSRYMAPEAVMGGVAAASDWWSLGMILLEQFTQGACFAEANPNAFLIHVFANGVPIPGNLDPSLRLLLRGLLARDWHQRWQWPQVRDWLAGLPVAAPDAPGSEQGDGHASIALGKQRYRNPELFALAAVQAEHWPQAKESLARGELLTWAERAGLAAERIERLRQTAQLKDTADDDFRLSLALKVLNPNMPLIHRGEIITPNWLLAHPLEAYRLVSGPLPELLDTWFGEQVEEGWLARLQRRATNIRQRAANQQIELNEDELRIYLLATSRAKLLAEWQERARLLPDSDHPGILALADRKELVEEDLIILLSASIGQFRSATVIIEEAVSLAHEAGIAAFSREKAAALLQSSRQELFRAVDERVGGFMQCTTPAVNEWAEQFRLQRRLSLAQALALLAEPPEHWTTPAKQQYFMQLMAFFGKKIATSSTRGVLARMSVNLYTPRIDLAEIHTGHRSATVLLEHVVQRNARLTTFGVVGDNLGFRLSNLYARNQAYRRDTGIDGLYLGFPFLLDREARNTRPRIIPLLLWPVQLEIRDDARHLSKLAFDRQREEVRLNPALESLLGSSAAKRWREAANVLLGRPAIRTIDVMETFAALARVRSHELEALPELDTEVEVGRTELTCAAVLFNVTFTGQAIREDLVRLQKESTASLQDTALATILQMNEEETRTAPAPSREILPELQRFFTVASDPSQEAAVLRARHAPGLLVEGPPGTGKSQTIVNIVTDAIGRGKSVLIVCQKYAALEVVRKRLHAEGLAERMMMVNDLQDRSRLLLQVRGPLERLFSLFEGRSRRTSLDRQRESLATRIEILEGELDRLHEAMYRVDEASGLSYRQVLGELIRLEASKPLPEAPALRGKLAPLGAAALAQHEQNCAALASAWLPSRYEDSPFAQLRVFAVDDAILQTFGTALRGFAEMEEQRQQVMQTFPASFEVENDANGRVWLEGHAAALLALPDDARQRLARWLPLFDQREGERLLSELETLSRELHALNTGAWSSRFSPDLNVLEDERLAKLAEYANRELQGHSWVARFNPLRLYRLATLRGFMTQYDSENKLDKQTFRALLPELLEAARLERQWRPLRARFSSLRRPFGLPEIASADGLGLAAMADGDVRQVREIQHLAQRLKHAPTPDEIRAAVLIGTKQAFEYYISQLEAALKRHATRQNSFKALSMLDAWISDQLADTLRQNIASKQNNAPLLGKMLMSLPDLRAFQIFHTRVAAQSANGQLNALDLELLACLRGCETELAQIPANELEEIVRRLFRREACLAWKERLERTYPELLYSEEEIQAKTDALAKADIDIRALNRELLTTNLDLDLLGNHQAWESITRLSGKRALRLREFIEQGVKLGLLHLTPIWLMNPDTASRVLPFKPGLFDIVIYDEASQMPVEYALPTLYRGRVAVVSGDEKQMPPPAFFSSRIENDEAEIFEGESTSEAEDDEWLASNDDWNQREIKDCPDLLQLGRTVLPGTTLQIHYRSVYRELIAFSNAAFYSNRLNMLARHPESMILRHKPLELLQVNGLYRHQVNMDEAEQVVSYLAKLWQQPERPSVGIVTFNHKQAELIEHRLSVRAEKDESFRAVYAQERNRRENGEDMSVFVKNVENVQGDERDFIVFSSTFGRNPQGVFRRNFGVLGQTGGERRLNVAITRARKKVVMVNSMPIRDVSDMLSTQHPPACPRDYLQTYLEYVRMTSAGEFAAAHRLLARLQTGRADADVAVAVEQADGFTSAVADFIRSLGLQPVSASEGDVFGLDFAIENPATKLYAIGIECDSPRHPLLSRARAREIWRPSVLRRSIKNIHRVSSIAWRNDGERERARLRAAIEKALEQDNSEMEQTS